jgi:UDP-N-acetylmuramyl pentapeptide phosphotransferase/UDP-N-acetylglucosamine-1-phosphate transferase
MLYQPALPVCARRVGAQRHRLHHVPHAAASLTALAISLALGPWLIKKLSEFQIGQVIRTRARPRMRRKQARPRWAGC